MGNYIVSARKYRPTTFDSVVGQHALTTTLKNAIATGKLAHAYLFCGPRGVGKTTCARIFAKTINCLTPTGCGEACNQCESCVAFNEQRSYNIFELDAASNNSVDDIRNLCDQVRIPPQIGRYKVYIIDEVHMLSNQAFNAFLKTLEEPPKHAIFILCTTEKHKVIPTILSRCQTYDFNRITPSDTIAHLQYVAKTEGIEVEDEALDIIAQKADGGMRDALSIFDQVVSYAGGEVVTYEKVIADLDVLNYDYYFRVTDMLLNGKVKDSMLLLNDILNHGFDAGHFMTGLASHLRNLLMAHDEATIPLLEVGEKMQQRYRQQAPQCKPRWLYRAMKICNDCDLNYRISKNKRLLVELTLIQCAQLSQDDDDPASGLGPTRIILKQIPEMHGQANTNEAKPQRTAAPRQASTKATPQANGRGQASNTPHELPDALKANAENTRKVPLVKHVGFSIHGQVADKVSENHSVAAEPSSTPLYAIPDAPLNEATLKYFWTLYANNLPREERATAARMIDMVQNDLHIADPNTIDAVVQNEMAYQAMEEQTDKLTRYLQHNLQNRQLKIILRICEPREVKRAYTNKEKYDLMVAQNPTLAKFMEVLQLELLP